MSEYAGPEFLENVHQARDNGFDLCCSDCGVGIHDESDQHDTYCPQNPDLKQNLDRARQYYADADAEPSR